MQNNNNSFQAKNSLGDFGQVHFRKVLLDYDYDDDVEPNNENKDNPWIISTVPVITPPAANVTGSTSSTSQISQFSTPEQERHRKLAELNKQEAAFEQRLAQTRLRFAMDCYHCTGFALISKYERKLLRPCKIKSIDFHSSKLRAKTGTKI
ncbi:unnamed protein product [Allacma fusca]|uniref:Uncharacterized protein n=1 Tax=Allacma fusca TaxID=39272 RepID=A0A8J2JVW8_9HEXA|nr:unnamed protein product [Allacma fusca]